MVAIYSTIPAEREDEGPELGWDLLDGDMKQVVPAGYDFSQYEFLRHEDGYTADKVGKMQGLVMTTEHLPTKIRLDGPDRYLKDFHMTSNALVVSEAFKNVVESLEPGKHQFVPVEVQYKNGSKVESPYYWMFVCTRLFGMDIEHTTHEYNEKRRTFKTINGNKYVGNLSQIGDHHIWVDMGVQWWMPYVSEAFKQAMAEAGIRGIGYNEKPAV